MVGYRVLSVPLCDASFLQNARGPLNEGEVWMFWVNAPHESLELIFDFMGANSRPTRWIALSSLSNAIRITLGVEVLPRLIA
jgi:hypothetical protein